MCFKLTPQPSCTGEMGLMLLCPSEPLGRCIYQCLRNMFAVLAMKNVGNVGKHKLTTESSACLCAMNEARGHRVKSRNGWICVLVENLAMGEYRA